MAWHRSIGGIAIFSAFLICTQPGAALAFEKKLSEKKSSARKAAAAVAAAPVVAVNSSLNPSDGSMINNAKPTISAEYVDEGIGVNPQGTKLYVDDVEVSSTSQVTPMKITYVPAVPLADGVHKVKLSIDDKAGNPTSASWSFTIRTKPPLVAISSHKSGAYVSNSPILLTGTVDDIKAKVIVNGVATLVEKGLFSAKVNISEGANTVTAVATDEFGNNGTYSITIILDSKPPYLEIAAPVANSIITAQSVTVTGKADKNAVSVSVTGAPGTPAVPAVLAAGVFTAKDVKLAEGANTIVVKAISQSGIEGKTEVNVTVDSIAPVIAIASPKDLSITNRKMVTISGAVDDPTAMVKVNNIPAQVSAGIFTLSGVSLSEGNNVITATAADHAGNLAKASALTVVLDTTPPAAPLLNQQTPITQALETSVTGTSEPGAQVEVFVNNTSQGTVKADEKGAFELKVKLVEGNNSIIAVALDAPGNASSPSAVLNIFLDTKPPRIL